MSFGRLEWSSSSIPCVFPELVGLDSDVIATRCGIGRSQTTAGCPGRSYAEIHTEQEAGTRTNDAITRVAGHNSQVPLTEDWCTDAVSFSSFFGKCTSISVQVGVRDGDAGITTVVATGSSFCFGPLVPPLVVIADVLVCGRSF